MDPNLPDEFVGLHGMDVRSDDDFEDVPNAILPSFDVSFFEFNKVSIESHKKNYLQLNSLHIFL